MAIENFFTDRCDIYRSEPKLISPGYALPAAPKPNHTQTPDLENVPCCFCIKGSRENISRADPMMNYEADIQLDVPAGTDIRLNDKVVDLATGFEYKAGKPHDIRGHHITVQVKRYGLGEALRWENTSK